MPNPISQRSFSNRLLCTMIVFGMMISGCSATASDPAVSTPREEPTATRELKPTATPPLTVNPPEATFTPEPLPGATLTATIDARIEPRRWAEWPVVPTVSATAKGIYAAGLKNGNDPHVFSVIGDCQSEPNVFLGIYESDRYWLDNEHAFLQETIDYYQGSFSRTSLSVRDGLSAPSALSPMWADPENCLANENPVACELRVRKPAIMFINLGTNWKAGASAEKYEEYLRQVVQLVIDNGTLPILSTKADNVEGDHSLNQATARVAYDFDIPLYNFWRAADDLPNHGLDAERDNIYLTTDGWNARNFYALMTLDAIRKELNP